MASGGIALTLDPNVTWEMYPEHSRKWIKILKAKVENEADTVCERIKVIIIAGHQFWLSFDDYEGGLHLEPHKNESNDLVIELQKKLEETGVI